MSAEMELAVLGCIFYDVDKEYLKLDDIKEEYFIDYRSQFKKILDYRMNNNPAEIDVSRDILGSDITVLIVQFKGSISNFSIYLKQIKQSYIISTISDKLTRTGTLEKDDFRIGLEAFTEKQSNKTVYNMTTDLMDWMKDLENRVAGTVEWYEWGLNFLDRELGKLKMGKFIILKALRKSGKTTLAINLYSSFIQRKLPTIFISTETGYNDLMDKMAALNTKIDSFNIQEGTVKNEMHQILETTEKNMYGRPGTILLCTRLTMDYIKKVIDEYNTKIIIIDFLQMLQVLDIPDGMNQTQVMDSMAIGIKGLCLERNITVIGLSQVNMEGWSKGCKAFEEKADTILSLTPRDKGIETPSSLQLDLNILNRNGRSGTIKILYMKKYGDFIEDTGIDEPKETIPTKSIWSDRD